MVLGKIEQLREQLREGNAFCRMRYDGTRYIVPVTVREDVVLDDLLEIASQKIAVMDNLQQFLAGRSYNHILLWGARGTGKSSLVRAAFHALHHHDLALLQLSCDDLQDLGFLLWVIGQQTRKFIVYIDDLSFAPDDDSYRALKAVLDGSIAGMPNNVVLCVTSNRRHLSEVYPCEQAIHPEENVEEQISLAERFGLRLSFHPLSQKQYIEIVAHWAKKAKIRCDDDLQRAALQFALARGSRSARVAEQFVRQQGKG